jgi:hypothetical protein
VLAESWLRGELPLLAESGTAAAAAAAESSPRGAVSDAGEIGLLLLVLLPAPLPAAAAAVLAAC